MKHFGSITSSIVSLGLIQDDNYVTWQRGYSLYWHAWQLSCQHLPSNVCVLLLFLRQLNSRRARLRGGIVPSQQQKASALPVWSSSAAETLVKGVVHTFDTIALAPLARPRLWGLQCQQKAMLQPQGFEQKHSES